LWWSCGFALKLTDTPNICYICYIVDSKGDVLLQICYKLLHPQFAAAGFSQMKLADEAQCASVESTALATD